MLALITFHPAIELQKKCMFPVCLGLFLGLRLDKSRIGSLVSFLVSLSSKLPHYRYVSTDDKNAIVAVKRVYSVNTYLRISTVPRGSEQSEWASLWMERMSKASVQTKHSEAEHCTASERSERCDRVACLKTRLPVTRNTSYMCESAAPNNSRISFFFLHVKIPCHFYYKILSRMTSYSDAFTRFCRKHYRR